MEWNGFYFPIYFILFAIQNYVFATQYHNTCIPIKETGSYSPFNKPISVHTDTHTHTHTRSISS